jgi:hypothetical protein
VNRKFILLGAGNKMEKKSRWKWMILPAALFILAFGLYHGYSFWQANNNPSIQKIREASAAQGGKVSDIAVFQQEAKEIHYKNVGAFIAEFHRKYNDTLGWGEINSVNWDEQKKTATDISTILVSVDTENADLRTDLQTIADYAEAIETGRQDKQTLITLHRYFHDLDILLNGYSQTDDFFNITEYKISNDD